MTPTQREAALRLIRAFDNERISLPAWESVCRQGFALLRELAAEPQGEPIAWATPDELRRMRQFKYYEHDMPLYLAAHPPQRKPLTREQIDAVWASLGSFTDRESDYRIFARGIERAHGM